MVKEKGAQINFELNFKSGEFSSLELPIEVRTTDLALVEKTLSSASIDVEPGEYIVSTVFPAGQSISQVLEVTSGQNNVVIQPPPDMQSPHESHESTHYFNQDLNQLIAQSAAPKPVTVDYKAKSIAEVAHRGLNFIVGKRVNGVMESSPFNKELIRVHKVGDEFLEFSIPGTQESVFAQLLQKGMPVLNVVLPVGIGHESDIGCKLILVPNKADSTYSMSVQLNNLEANLLIRYQEEGAYDQINTVSRSKKNDPLTLVESKQNDPIAAAVGAYAILKFDDMSRLQTWTENLKNWFPWLPDGAAIRGEHLARSGEDQLALESFILLLERGMPMFSDGLSYALVRLRNYVGNWAKYFGDKGTHTHYPQAIGTLAALQRYESSTDFKKTVLTFTGSNLDGPNQNVVEESLLKKFDFDLDEEFKR